MSGHVERGLRVAITCAVVALIFGGIAFLVRLSLGDGSTDELGQPRVEREAQRRLPSSSDPIWPLLRQTKITEDAQRGVFMASFPKSVAALDGRELTIDGFMLPLEANAETHHFLLSRYTPVCPFCPPGEPNEIVEVYARSSIVPTPDEVTVTGRLGLQRDGGGGLFFRLDDADVS